MAPATVVWLATGAGWLALALVFVALQFTLAALLISLYFRPKPYGKSGHSANSEPPSLPAITLLIPCEGAEAGLEARLRSSLVAPYPALRQVIFCLSSPQDGANQAVEAVLKGLEQAPIAGVEAQVVYSQSSAAALNRKVKHLAAGVRLARHPVLVSADSDVLFEATTLPALVSCLVAEPGRKQRMPGLSYAPPRFSEGGGLPDRLLAYGFTSSPHAFYVLKALADFTGGERPVVGSLMAYRRETLEKIGGYQSIAGHIGDDLELGRQIEGLGLGVEVSPVTACCPNPDLSTIGLLQKLHRWIVVGGAYGYWRLFSYPTLLAPLPLVAVLLALCAGLGGTMPPLGWGLLGCMAGGRLLLGAIISQVLYQRTPRSWDPMLLVLWELSLSLCSVWALCHATVNWRGRRLRIQSGGGILPLSDPSRPGVPEVPARKGWMGRYVLPAYARWLTRSHLHAVWVRGLEKLPPDNVGPLLLMPNHCCWWDGIVAYVLHNARISRDFFIMMEDTQLRKYQFFSWAGAFSIRRGHLRSAGWSLQYAEELLSDRQRALWIFPQGIMMPEGRRPLRFELGAVRLSRRLPDAWVIPVALHYAVRAHPHAEVFVCLGEPLRLTPDAGDAQTQSQQLEQAVTTLLEDLRSSLTETPLEQVPPGFERILSGRQGVAETWDRVRASVGLLPKEP